MMGYRTVNQVPTILTHAQAKRIFEKSVPIRGRSEADSRRPLGARRDADTYHIRMNGDDVECVLYKTPVITFHTDDTITIKTDGWNSVSTHQFIWAITGCYARGSKGKTVIKVGALEYVMSDICQMKYLGGSAQWEMLTTEEHYDWRIDRQKAKEVRAKYKEFNTYLSGVIKLRSTTVQDQLCIESSVDELYEGLSLTLYADHNGRESINTDAFRLIDNKNKSEHAKFMYLIDASGEGKADKTDDYHKAMLMLIGRCETANYWHLRLGRKITVYPKVLIDKAYECMYKYHSDEVFTKVKLPVGKVPSGRYDTWV